MNSPAQHSAAPLNRRIPLIADVISWSYAALIITFCLVYSLNFTVLGATLAMVLFLILRLIARELHRVHSTTSMRAL